MALTSFWRRLSSHGGMCVLGSGDGGEVRLTWLMGNVEGEGGRGGGGEGSLAVNPILSGSETAALGAKKKAFLSEFPSDVL